MRQNKTEQRPTKRRLSTLIMLVLFVFIILLLSVVCSGIVLQFFVTLGILPSLSNSRLPVVLLFMILVSLFIGTVLALIGGDYMLRPLHKLINATKEVAAGNFDVRVSVNSSTELNRLAVSFNEMAEELSSVETLRTDFVRNISHEFKTPVASIRGYAKRLKKKTLPEEKREEYLDIIIAETERLAQLSSNVLLLSNLENTGRISEQSRFLLDEQMRNSILMLEPQLEKKGLLLDLNLAPVFIEANQEMMSHIWINLLGNAIKFSPEGGVIRVSLRQAGAFVEVVIADQGIGMDEEVAKHIFDKFYQADTSRATAGNGLGLSLVSRILALCGGSIAVESAPGKGAAFTVTLPLEHNSAGESHTAFS